MPTLTIEGRKITVDDSFLSMSPEEQNAAVEEIGRELSLAPRQPDQAGAAPADTGEDGGSTFGGIVQNFGERFNRGLYGFANLPTTLANAATSAAGIDYRFQRPLEAMAPGLDQTIMDVPEPRGPAEKVAGYIGEFTGANAIPGATMIGAAPRLAAATANATGTAGRSVNAMAQGIANAPGAAAAGELLSSVGSGLGASMAEGAGPNAEYLAATLGGFAAPMAVALSPSNLARKGFNAARKRFSPDELARQQRQQIAEGFRKNMTPDSEAALRETMAIRQDVPDYRPSVAEATENPSFIATQREFERGLSGVDLDAAVRRYGMNDQAIRRAIQEQAPQSPANLDDAFAAGRNRLSRIGSAIDNQAAGLDRRAAQVSDSIQPGQRRRELGAAIREDLLAARSATKEEMGITARELGLNDPAARFPFARVKQRLIDAAKPRSKLSDRSALPTSILRDIEAMDDSASIVDLMTLRTRITDDIRESRRLPTGDKRVPYLEALKTELDGATEDLIRAVGDPDLSESLATFRRIYRDDYIQPFETGAAARVAKTDASGSYVVPDEDVAREFFNKWNQTDADQFNRVFPNAGRARSAMEAVALDDLHTTATRNGVLEPSLVEAWSRRNKGVLQAFPELRGKVANIEQTLAAIGQRRATLMNRKRTMEESLLAREVGRIEKSTASPEIVIDGAMRNPQRMAKIMTGLKTKAAKDAIARHAWDSALSSDKPGKFLADHVGAAKVALGPKRYALAQRLARAIEKNKLVRPPEGAPIDTNPVAFAEQYLGTGLNQISSRVFAVKSGRTSARYALSDIAGRAFRTMSARQARETMREALYDPEIATTLANAMEFRTISEPQARRLYTFILSNGIAAGAEDAGSGEGERQPLELTVTPRDAVQ